MVVQNNNNHSHLSHIRAGLAARMTGSRHLQHKTGARSLMSAMLDALDPLRPPQTAGMLSPVQYEGHDAQSPGQLAIIASHCAKLVINRALQLNSHLVVCILQEAWSPS